MKITLLGHSGFLVEGETARLVFDYFTDEPALLDKLPLQQKKTVFFASHSHRDHYNKKIFDYAGAGEAGYVLDRGIRAPAQAGAPVVQMEKGQAASALGIAVQAFGSTDTGVSFLVELEGKSIFHAGDLNDWYWEEESTPEELAHDEQWFLDEIAPLAGVAPDVAFLPVDIRLGRHALRGALHFARLVKPGLIVPMHLCGGYDLPGELRGRLMKEGLPANVACLLQPGDNMEL